jgi:hypothetical protein
MRFSLAQLLWATFWLGILISLWRFIESVNYHSQSLDPQVEQMFIASVIMWSVSVIGVINRRPKTAAAIGILAAMLTVTYVTQLVH